MVNSTDLGCQCEWLANDACTEPFYKMHNAGAYCVLHYSDSAKTEDFAKAIEVRLDASNPKYLDFVGVWFPSPISFTDYNFKTRVDFSLARFTSGVSFIQSHFQEVSFADAQFEEHVDFRSSQFIKSADFSRVEFKSETRARSRKQTGKVNGVT